MALRRAALCLGLAATLSPPTAAQVPPNTAVVGTISFDAGSAGWPIRQSGTTGLFLAPLPNDTTPTVQPATRITGLPAQLTVPASTWGGVWSVVRHPADGTLVVGPFAGGVSRLHLLTLQGTAVASTTSLTLGSVLPGWYLGIGTALFPDGRVLVTMERRSLMVPGSGPGAVSELAILDRSGSTPTLTSVPIAAGAFTGSVEGPQVSADGRTAYVMTHRNGGQPPWRLYSVDVDASSPSYGAVRLLHTFLTGAFLSDPELREDGRMFVTAIDMSTPSTTVHTIDTTTSPVTVSSVTTGTASLFAMDPATDPADGKTVYGSIDVVGGAGGAYAGSLVFGADPLAPLTPFASAPAGGWCMPWTIDIHSSFERYGEGTAATNGFRVVDRPNPGGLPQVGNAGFGIDVASSGGVPQAAWLVLGTQPLAATMLGVDVLVAPGVVVPMAVGTSSTLPLPIPRVASLAGTTLYAQALLLDGGALASSDAVRIQIQP